MSDRGGLAVRTMTAADVVGWPDAGPCVAVERDGVVVGWASRSAYRPNRAAYVHIREFSVYVDRSAHGAGVGRAALAWMTSAEGVAFMERSGRLWDARAKQCVDVYTGRAEPPQP